MLKLVQRKACFSKGFAKIPKTFRRRSSEGGNLKIFEESLRETRPGLSRVPEEVSLKKEKRNGREGG